VKKGIERRVSPQRKWTNLSGPGREKYGLGVKRRLFTNVGEDLVADQEKRENRSSNIFSKEERGAPVEMRE